MIRLTFICFLAFLINTSLYSQNSNPKIQNTYPFKIYDTKSFVISAKIEGELYPKYATFFEKLGYSGNGYCWEGHIVQILEKVNPELLNHLNFDPEAGGFYAYADTKENRQKFLDILCPIFNDLKLLEDYVKKADRAKVDD